MASHEALIDSLQRTLDVLLDTEPYDPIRVARAQAKVASARAAALFELDHEVRTTQLANMKADPTGLNTRANTPAPVKPGKLLTRTHSPPPVAACAAPAYVSSLPFFNFARLCRLRHGAVSHCPCLSDAFVCVVAVDLMIWFLR